ncbi:symmetrical bis(5'-nucleosyl)-tetraphosphatase [Chitinimonas sp.]|uniref:symmetrical bis(5'-nucleosyl)-tetraphosphatase n=1 Tax=Chitinimonas sp. TaxID=1934313 RepID=UPI002F94A833
MSTYAVGDLQGCLQELLLLLQLVDFDPQQDRLYLVGDLVNRGPESLEVLRWVHAHRHAVRVVLGNHDLHLLAVHAGLAKNKGRDTLSAILAAPDAAMLMDWLRRQPLVQQLGKYVFVHAGLLPQWTVSQALGLSVEVQQALSGPQAQAFLAAMYGNQPLRWDEGLQGYDRLRLIVNACTRMRLLAADGSLEMEFKGELKDAPADCVAWFDAPGRLSLDATVVCGHWSALGLLVRPDVIALDTGCVWGGRLSGIRLEDGQVFQVPSRQPPGRE